MLIPRVAKRYAEAVYSSVPSELGAESFLADLRDLRATLNSSRELRAFFASPVIPHVKKQQIIQSLFGSEMHEFTNSFLLFLLRKRREHMLLQIIQSVLELHRMRMGIQEFSVATANELSADQKDRITGTIRTMTGKAVESGFDVDTRLLGGVVLRLGDKVYDGSIVRQLQRLRYRLKAGGDQ